MTKYAAYEREPYRRSLETAVVEGGIDGDRHFVVLADTILYPEGGGQPADRGRIAGIPVEDVRKVDGRIRHYLGGAAPAGRVQVELDWTRRFDHMQQHSGQHLLTAVAQDRFGWHTTAFHLGQQVSDIELDVPGVTPEQLADLEEAVAALIRAAHPVTGRRVKSETLATLPVRTRGLPEGHEGDIRLVEIAGIDLNTCGGTHVASTAEIEALKLLGTEPMRGGTRLFYVAGGRLRRLLATHHERTARLRQLLGASDEELAAAVAAKLDQLREAQRAVRASGEELAVEAARALAAGAEKVASAHWEQRDLPFLQQVARVFVSLAPDRLALLTAGAGEEGYFLLCGGAQVAVDLAALGREVAGILAGRGGGAGRAFQGKATALSRRGEALAKLRALMEGG
ncbi:MAG TPA: alanyl-tRNA editing protein [Candidatus Methylomirabilis sp.]|nr:alanyl-tRNA editing protein [Candidatus Methylomirabilis sp.]